MREEDRVGGTSSRPRVARLIAGYGAIACAVPYLALKAVWLSGGNLGVAQPALMQEPSMIALNAITAGMDLVGIALALAFTHEWGLRLPAWILLPPMWVATGLLARFVVGVPVTMLNALLSGSVPRGSGGPVQPWVYIVVYIGFAGMGIGLLAAFFLYARTRWAAVLESPLRGVEPGATREVQSLLANATATLALALGVLHLAWAAVGRRGSLVSGIDGALMVCAAAGVSMMARRIGGTVRFWLPVTMTWVGAGSMFAWGAWQTTNVLGQTALLRPTEGMALVNLVGLFNLIVGLAMGLLALFMAAERHAQS